jgi:hypothetical protein
VSFDLGRWLRTVVGSPGGVKGARNTIQKAQLTQSRLCRKWLDEFAGWSDASSTKTNYERYVEEEMGWWLKKVWGELQGSGVVWVMDVECQEGDDDVSGVAQGCDEEWVLAVEAPVEDDWRAVQFSGACTFTVEHDGEGAVWKQLPTAFDSMAMVNCVVSEAVQPHWKWIERVGGVRSEVWKELRWSPQARSRYQLMLWYTKAGNED